MATWSLVRSALIRIGDGTYSLKKSYQVNRAILIPVYPVSIDGQTAGHLWLSRVRLTDDEASQGWQDVILSEDIRREAETAIEQFARILALEHNAEHSISSTSPYIGLHNSDSRNLERLDGVPINVDYYGGKVGAKGESELLSEANLPILAERHDGVALLAEALNCPTALGKYVQLVRLFERAFKDGPHAITAPLAEFLVNGSHAVTEDEVRWWLEARSYAMHADRRPDFFLDSNVRPMVSRMTEAAYDVLMNKKQWRDKTPDRQDRWAPSAGTSALSGNQLFFRRERQAQMNFTFFDAFYAYPIVLASGLEPILPRAAWLEASESDCVLSVKGDASFGHE